MRYDVNSNEWIGDFSNEDGGQYSDGNFLEALTGSFMFDVPYSLVHQTWLEEITRLASVHGAIRLSDDSTDRDAIIFHKSVAPEGWGMPGETSDIKAFNVYWRTTGVKGGSKPQGTLIDLFKQSPKPQPDSCPSCKSENLRTIKGKTHHAAELRCLNCDRHIKWLPKSDPRSQQFLEPSDSINLLNRCLKK